MPVMPHMISQERILFASPWSLQTGADPHGVAFDERAAVDEVRSHLPALLNNCRYQFAGAHLLNLLT